VLITEPVELGRGRRLKRVASRSRSVPGHHGTRAEWKDRIISDGFLPTTNDQGWFGDGSYFFEDAPKLADEWARMKHPEYETCVFEAEITLARCLDLLDGVGPEKLRPFYERYIGLRGRDAVAELKQNEYPDAYGDFDCHVINLACETLAEDGERFDVVRGSCKSAGPIYEDPDGELPSSRPSLREHIQLAVRDNCAILSFEQVDSPTTGKGSHGAE
jgi:hypothetical protein